MVTPQMQDIECLCYNYSCMMEGITPQSSQHRLLKVRGTMQAPALMLICASWCRIQQQHDLHKAQLGILSVHMRFKLHVTCPQILVESSLVGMNACAYKHIHTCVHTSHAYTKSCNYITVMCTLHVMSCTCHAIQTTAVNGQHYYHTHSCIILYVKQQTLKLPDKFHIHCVSAEQHYKTSFTSHWKFVMHVWYLYSSGSTHQRFNCQVICMAFFGCEVCYFQLHKELKCRGVATTISCKLG